MGPVLQISFEYSSLDTHFAGPNPVFKILFGKTNTIM